MSRDDCPPPTRKEIRLRALKSWKLLSHDRDLAARLAGEINCSPVLAQLLVNRGITKAEDSRRFLAAELKGMHDPDLLPGVRAAAARIHQAIRDKKRIC